MSMFLEGFTFSGVPLTIVFRENFALWPIDSGFWPWQLVTYQFMHGGFGHLFFNMLALWMFGMELENMWGTKRFALFYTLSGMAAGIAQLVVSPLFGELLGPTIGASGSVMGILIAFGMLFPKRPVMIFPIFFPIPAKYFVMIWIGIDLFLGVSSAADGTAHFAHLGGALGGFLLLKFGGPFFDWMENRSTPSTSTFRDEPTFVDAEYRDAPPEQPTVRYDYRSEPPAKEATPTRFVVEGESITQEQIDEILDKISQAGYRSLSEREKNILYQVSKQL